MSDRMTESQPSRKVESCGWPSLMRSCAVPHICCPRLPLTEMDSTVLPDSAGRVTCSRAPRLWKGRLVPSAAQYAAMGLWMTWRPLRTSYFWTGGRVTVVMSLLIMSAG